MNIKEIEKKVNKMGMRERILVLFTSLAIVYFTWDSMVYSSLFSSKEEKSNTATSIRNKITSMQTQLDKLSAAIKIDPTQSLKNNVTKLISDNNALEDEIIKLMSQLIPAKEMANLLGKVLAADKNIKIIDIKNIKEVPLFVDKNAKEKEASEKFQVYKHGLEIEFEANYFDTIQFLQTIENLQWKLLWSEFSYSVTKHPIAQVKVLINTLSSEQSWIGI